MKTFLVLAAVVLVFVGFGFAIQNLDVNFPTPLVEEASYPDPSNYAVDAAGVLSADQVASLNARLKALADSGQEIGIAVVPSLYGQSVEQYSMTLAEKWKVGDDTLDNGILIVLAPNERKVRVEIGYGLEATINDSKAGRIVDEYMIPSLKENKWYDALVGGIEGLTANLK